jgi:tripartite-type tricarboxylate transporter receptor subunit TctC
MRKNELIPKRKSLLMKTIGALFALALVIPLSPAVAATDSYPSKLVRVIIPMAPGGSTDIVGRMLAPKLTERLGKQIIMENHGGAGGVIGMEMVARSEPDGYTLLMTSPAFIINPFFHQMPYDPVKSFVPVARLVAGSRVLLVHPSVPANSVKEFIALAKNQPGKLVYASTGVGSDAHLAGELFKMMAGIDFKIVQFKSGGQAITDVLGGHSHWMLGTVTLSLSQIRSGKLKALGISGSVRSNLIPDVPTISEAGVPGYEASQWLGVLAPAGTPKAIVDRLHKELAEILNSEDTKKMLEEQGQDLALLGPTEFGKFMAAETAKWGKVNKEGNIKVK